MLASLLEDTLDPAYAEAAARRGGPDDGSRSQRLPQVIVGVLVMGLILGIAYTDTRAEAPSSERARLALLADVQRDSARSAQLQDRLEDLRMEVAEAVDAALASTEDGREQSELVRQLEAATGVLAVEGPGLVVTVSDAAPEEALDPVTGDAVEAVPEAGLVLDIDLQAVVNALWAAGAEAIAIDGQRLAPTSSIRTAGEAILVDFRPVSSPYLVESIGDPDVLVPRFAGSETAARYDAYRQLYGIGFELLRSERISLAAATDYDLRYAHGSAPPSVGENK
ncbi:MAG: DUF881 domain-containing protein [Geodermatophilaceae bacterium]|nr:DUF881 domain-containing protein [Geodermatophilaceae bacterium]